MYDVCVLKIQVYYSTTELNPNNDNSTEKQADPHGCTQTNINYAFMQTRSQTRMLANHACSVYIIENLRRYRTVEITSDKPIM